MAVVCEHCLGTEIIDTNPLFFQDTDGLKYLSLIHARKCKCDGKRDHHWIPKPEKDGKIAPWIGADVVRTRFRRERVLGVQAVGT